MELLIIHDGEGYILKKEIGQPVPREPVGVPFIWATIPEGKRSKNVGEIGINVSVSPHEVILEDIPPSETELLKQEVQTMQEALDFLLIGGM